MIQFFKSKYFGSCLLLVRSVLSVFETSIEILEGNGNSVGVGKIFEKATSLLDDIKFVVLI